MILAIDPGSTESGFALIDTTTCRPLEVGKIPNECLRERISNGDFDDLEMVAIEMVASYGMAVGKEVFETCVWIGRYLEVVNPPIPVQLIYRRNVKLHLCGTSKAKDANITQALIDRFASGQPNRGKGTKADPGWFYGFKADIWQAYALAVLTADTAAKAVA
jgi:Holliday junction resolvasome RuvABC endonuclease subunit